MKPRISTVLISASCTALLTLLASTATAQCEPAGRSLVSWLPLDATATDILGSNHGTVIGTPVFGAGHVGGALRFDSDDDAVVIADDPSLDVNAGGFTVEFWMRGDAAQVHAQFLVVDKSHGWIDSTGWLFQGDTSTGVVHFGIGAGGPSSSNFPTVPSVGSVLDGAFHHIAGTWNGTQIELFIDGASQGTTPLSTPANNDRPVHLGFSWGGGTPRRFFRGEVDELGVYARALTQSEIVAIANAGSSGKCRPSASCTFRNGSGINPTGYVCTTDAVLGSSWVTTMPTEATTLTTFMAIAAVPGQFPLFGGELLIDPTGPVLFLEGNGTHTVPIPSASVLLGVLLPTQGLRVDAPGGQPQIVLFNALDIVLGL